MSYRRVAPEVRQEIVDWWNKRNQLGSAVDKAEQYGLSVAALDAIIREEKEKLRAKLEPIVLRQSKRKMRKLARIAAEQSSVTS